MTFCRIIYVKKVMKLLAFIFEQPSYVLNLFSFDLAIVYDIGAINYCYNILKLLYFPKCKTKQTMKKRELLFRRTPFSCGRKMLKSY